MPIQVTCPGCLKRFQVNEKFAGKTGPCPSCSKPITIPAKSDEVVIHAPDAGGPTDSKGRPVFKPIRREEVKITLPAALAVAGFSVVSIGVAVLVRFATAEPPTALLVLGSILLAPPLVWAGYWFLRDDELEGYRGKELITRCAIVSLVFVLTWGLYAFVPKYIGGYQSLAQVEVFYLLLTVPLMIGMGMAASILTLELETGQGVLHYLLYFAITLVLALIMGTPLAEPFARSAPAKAGSPGGNSATGAAASSSGTTATPPAKTAAPGQPAAPAKSGAPAKSSAPAQPPASQPDDSTAPKKPRLLQ
jgi:hypothetical protein